MSDYIPANTKVNVASLNAIELRNQYYNLFDNLEFKMKGIDPIDFSENGCLAAGIVCLCGFLIIANIGNFKALLVSSTDRNTLKSERNTVSRISKRSPSRGRDTYSQIEIHSNYGGENSVTSKISTINAV